MASKGMISRDAIVSNGCQTMPGGTKLEIIERYPSGTEGMRVIKVKASGPRVKPTVGFTIEIDK